MLYRAKRSEAAFALYRKLLPALVLTASAAIAQPRIGNGGTLNAASYGSLRAGGSGLAQGAMITIFGEGLGPAVLVSAPSLPLPTELAGTRVRIGNQDAFLIYSSTRQVAAIVPSTVPVGAADVAVTFNGQISQAQRVNIVAADFGLFTRNSGGYGPAIVQNFVSDANVPLNQLTASATPGQTVILYGTGLGAIDIPDNVAPGVKAARVSVQVIVGGRTVTPAYAGRSPNFPALDQINFVLPSDVAAGCYVPLSVRAGNRVSNTGSLSIGGAGGVCDHPLGLQEGALRRLEAGQTITMALLGLNKFNFAGLAGGEAAAVSFAEVDASGVFVQSGLSSLASNLPLTFDTSVITLGSPGQCFITNVNPEETTDAPDLPANPAVRILDAGTLLRLSGPANRSRDLTRVQGGTSYAATLSSSFLGGTGAPFLQAGQWQISGTGGTDVGSFNASVTLPDPLALVAPPTSVTRSGAMTVNWTGGTGNDLVYIAGISIPGGLLNAGNSPVGAFVCTALASVRTFTVPANIVAQLPVGEGALLLINQGAGSRPTIPLVRGGNVDIAAFTYSFIDSAQVRFQ
jgi:uncharacterized protein (TIGR03437 family)